MTPLEIIARAHALGCAVAQMPSTPPPGSITLSLWDAARAERDALPVVERARAQSAFDAMHRCRALTCPWGLRGEPPADFIDRGAELIAYCDGSGTQAHLPCGAGVVVYDGADVVLEASRRLSFSAGVSHDQTTANRRAFLGEGAQGAGVLGVDGESPDGGLRAVLLPRPDAAGAPSIVGDGERRNPAGHDHLPSVRQSDLRAARSSLSRNTEGEHRGHDREGARASTGGHQARWGGQRAREADLGEGPCDSRSVPATRGEFAGAREGARSIAGGDRQGPSGRELGGAGACGLIAQQFAEVSAVRIALAITDTSAWRARPLVVRTDSMYTIGALTAPAAPPLGRPNARLISVTRGLLVGRTVRFEHVRGHSGEPGNERADKLAGLARLRGVALQGAA